jgi:SAM-dependent methyltransferase
MMWWRNTLYTVLWSAGRSFHLAGRAFMYLAAGTLRRRDLRDVTTRTWDDFGRNDDLIQSGLMFWERDVYEAFLKPTDHILLIGCGSGRDLLALLKRGYRVDGIDLSARAIARAREILDTARLSADLYTGAIETAVPGGSYDAFIFSWFCYGYVAQRDTRISLLATLRMRLQAGGRIFISYVPADGAPRTLPIRLARAVGRLTGSDWHPEVGDVIETFATDRRAVRYEHHFASGELEAEAAGAGFEIVLHRRGDLGVAVLAAADLTAAGAGRTRPSRPADR